MTKLFFLLIISTAIVACKRETIELNNFYVTFQNNYFESLDSVSFADTTFILLDTNKITNPINVTAGKYYLHCISHSQLSIDANIDIKGSYKKINIIINSKGKIIIQ